MSGCYDYEYDYDYCNNEWDYSECHRPRRRRHHKRHNECWDYAN